MNIMESVLIAFVFFIAWRIYIFPSFYMKPIQIDCIDKKKNEYCLIDVRDFITFYRSPTEDAKNIPLSYLSREIRSELSCEKDIVVIAEDRRSARMAGRILKKQMNKQIYYITI